MTTHRFGSIAGLDEEGVVDATNAVLLKDVATVAFQGARFVPADRGGLEVDQAPSFALQLAGRINKSQDTVQVVWLVSPEGLSLLIGMAIDAADRAGMASAVLGDAASLALEERAKRDRG